jgi:hypothetical protein
MLSSSFSPWWANLPHDEQMGWRIPIEVMFDIEHLRKTRPVLSVREYLAMHGLDPSVESATGKWEPELYHSGTTRSLADTNELSIFSVPNEDYDPSHLVLVDILPQSSSLQSFPNADASADGKLINNPIRCATNSTNSSEARRDARHTKTQLWSNTHL